MSGFMGRLDLRSRGFQLLVLLLTLLLCLSFSLSLFSPAHTIPVSRAEPLAGLQFSESTGTVRQDIAELHTGPRFAAPLPPDVYSLNFEEPVKNIARTPYRLSVTLDKPSRVIASNIGGHAPPASPAFADGSAGQAI